MGNYKDEQKAKAAEAKADAKAKAAAAAEADANEGPFSEGSFSDYPDESRTKAEVEAGEGSKPEQYGGYSQDQLDQLRRADEFKASHPTRAELEKAFAEASQRQKKVDEKAAKRAEEEADAAKHSSDVALSEAEKAETSEPKTEAEAEAEAKGKQDGILVAERANNAASDAKLRQ